MLTIEEAAKVNKHLIKSLSEIRKKKKRESYICQIQRNAVLIIQKYLVVLQKDDC